MMIYLCYDLKGIQSFIFAVPRLRYICGGSALIDRFDREKIRKIEIDGCRRLFSGGGKGAFECNSAEGVESLKEELIEAAHEMGLDIAFGQDRDYNEAANGADEFYPYLPKGEELEGRPCKESGLFPVGNDVSQVHPMIQKRVRENGERVDRHFEKELLENLEGERMFFHDVSSEETEGRIGAAALGNRNRWAIIAMDGNEIGLQHRFASEKYRENPKVYQKWLGRMSEALDECSREACRKAIGQVVKLWEESDDSEQAVTRDGITVLPVRPLLVGGDDILVLCHVRYAFDFVREACRVFAEKGEELHEELVGEGLELWPATGGRISVSAGILFAPVTLPLATALPYAEQLLGSAKQRGREARMEEAAPAPPSVDWESVTEGLLTSMPSRRQSEMRFYDRDIGAIVELTRRPYTMEEFSELESLFEDYREIPNVIRHRILVELQAPYWERKIALGRLAKNENRLVRDLDETENEGRGRWRNGEATDGGKVRSTDVVDAVLLLQEDSRMNSQTVGNEG